MSTVEAVDAEAVEVGQELEQVQQHSLFRTDDPLEVLERAAKVADSLRGVLRKQGLVQKIQGKEHVLVEGWTLLGAMLGVTAVCVGSEPVDGGFKATVEARTRDGVVVGRADAVCTKHEKRGPWKSADDYARLSMAQTRATSKALKGPLGFVVSLAGFAATPAEEMHGVAEPETPADNPLPHPKLQAAYREWLAAKGDVGALRGVVKEMGGTGGTLGEAIGSLTDAKAQELLLWLSYNKAAE